VTSFRPCAATVSHFLYAQGNLIVSLHHDTLAIDRHFDKHREDVLLIAADNVSELGAGRFVASYDAGQTAIIWNIFTGEEVARFTAYEQIQVAAWTREGNVAFGESAHCVETACTNCFFFEAIPRATLSCSNPRQRNTSLQGQLSTQ